MYVTDTPVIDRLTNPEPMEEPYHLQDDMQEYVLNMGLADAEETRSLALVDRFADELATRLAAIV